jgi:hypothetical protein
MTIDAVATEGYPASMRNLRMMSVVLFAALPVAAAAQTAPWVVRDVDGTLVGSVLQPPGGAVVADGFETDSPLRVARRIPGKWIQLLMTRNAVRGTKDSVPFLYEDSDCRGPAFLEAPRKSSKVHATVVFDTSVFWPTGPVESRVIRAKGVYVRDPGQCSAMLVEPDLCCTVVEADEARFVAEVDGAALAQLQLRPPFRIEQVVESSK